jgi:hypothetical protein
MDQIIIVVVIVVSFIIAFGVYRCGFMDQTEAEFRRLRDEEEW